MKNDSLTQSSPFDPIESIEDDFFGFQLSAQFIADAILNSPASQSRVYSIEGSWGSGKSSLLRLISKHLESPEAGRRPVVLGFSPWLISDPDLLVRHFVASLARSFDDINHAQYSWYSVSRWINIWRKFRLQTKFHQYEALTSTASSLFSGMGLWYAVPVGLLLKVFRKQPSLEKLRSTITNLIAKLANHREHMKVVVVIDDLDRLSPDEIMLVIRLIKAVGDFQRVNYLILFDKEIVVSAIENSVEVSSGDAYLEKIVQLRFPLPKPGPFDIRRFFRTKLENEFPEDADWQSHRANVVLDVWAGRLLQTPRDVIKVFEAVSLKWTELKKGSADLLDLIWLQIVHEKASTGESNLYSWTLNYLSMLEALAIGGNVSQRSEVEKELEDILLKLGWKRPAKRKEYSENDYHFLGQVLLGVNSTALQKDSNDRDWLFQIDDGGFDEAKEQRRLSSPWHWTLYTRFEQSANGLNDALWDSLRESVHGNTDAQPVISKLNKLVGTSNPRADSDTIGDQLLQKIVYDMRGNPAQSAIWFEAIMDIVDKLFSRSRPAGFGFSKTIERLVKLLSETAMQGVSTGAEREALLANVFSNSPSIWALSEIYRDEFFRRKPNSSTTRASYLTDKEFRVVEDNLKRRVESISSADLAVSPSAWDTVYAVLNLLGESEARQWFERLTVSDEDLLQILRALETIKSSTQTIAGVPHSWLNGIAQSDQILKRVEKIARSNKNLSAVAENIRGNWYDGDKDY